MKLQLKAPTIPRRYRVVLMLLLPAAILAAAYFFLFDPQLREQKKLETEIEGTRQELLKITAMKNNMERTRREYASLKANLQYRLEEMPEEQEVPSLLRQVSLAAQETRTHMKYFAPKEPAARAFYSEMPFEMRYTGSYHNIGYFFDGIRKLERIIHITSFALEAKGSGPKGVLEGTCLAKTYIFTKEPLPPANGGAGQRTDTVRPVSPPPAGAAAAAQPAQPPGAGEKK